MNWTSDCVSNIQMYVDLVGQCTLVDQQYNLYGSCQRIFKAFSLEFTKKLQIYEYCNKYLLGYLSIIIFNCSCNQRQC